MTTRTKEAMGAANTIDAYYWHDVGLEKIKGIFNENNIGWSTRMPKIEAIIDTAFLPLRQQRDELLEVLHLRDDSFYAYIFRGDLDHSFGGHTKTLHRECEKRIDIILSRWDAKDVNALVRLAAKRTKGFLPDNDDAQAAIDRAEKEVTP